MIARWSRLPVVPLPGGGTTELPLVYAGNVAAGVLGALDCSVAVGRAYNLARDHPITGRQLVRLVGERLGRRPHVVPVPAGPLVVLAGAAELAMRMLPGVQPRDAARGIWSLTRDNPYDSARARLELGWSGLVPHEEGWRRTLA